MPGGFLYYIIIKAYIRLAGFLTQPLDSPTDNYLELVTREFKLKNKLSVQDIINRSQDLGLVTPLGWRYGIQNLITYFPVI